MRALATIGMAALASGVICANDQGTFRGDYVEVRTAQV